ncbi:hypothetical protein [Rhodococcus sp. IEGM 1318]|uniref:hypothetical protein n=1 Tax=Rhodococcus sp. IEGM 1318 TaxID=3082226 RepID=UPI00295373A9|nr:hypothetical protein [Rhodococcus sp. IEGM 1318]MDV8008460.1 hypothetical protein [Rhodococcus sp. IEGM 1318]
MTRDTKTSSETVVDEAFPSATANPTRRRKTAIIGAVVALLAVVLGIALIAAVRDDSDPVVDQDARLGQAVDGMYSDLLRGDTRSAYQYRSERCRRALNEEQYNDAITELFEGQDTGKGSIEYRVTTRAPGQATVDITFDGIDVPILEGYSRLWTLENGDWKYDSCE